MMKSLRILAVLSLVQLPVGCDDDDDDGGTSAGSGSGGSGSASAGSASSGSASAGSGSASAGSGSAGSAGVCDDYEQTILGCNPMPDRDFGDACQDQVDKHAAQNQVCKDLSEAWFQCLADSDCTAVMDPAAACTAEITAISDNCDPVTPPGS